MASTDVGIRISAIDATQGAFASVSKSLGLLDSQASLIGSTLKSTLAGLAGTLTVGAFVGLIRSATDAIDRLNDLADATGASIENLSALEGVARRTGTSLDVVGTSLVKFNQALSSAKPGSDAERAIKALGLSVADLKAQDPAQALQATAKALAGFADDANKARLVQELFGKSLREVAPLLKDLAEGGKPLATVTRAQAEEAEKFNKQLFILQTNAGDAARTLASALLPTMNRLFEDFNNFNKNRALASAASDVLEFNKQLEALQKRQAGPFNFAANLGKEIEKVTGQLAAAKAAFNALDEAGRRNNISNGRSAFAERQGIGERPSAPDLGRLAEVQDAAAARAAADLAQTNAALKLYNDLVSQASGFSAQFAEQTGLLSAAFARGKVNAKEFSAAFEQLLAQQPGAKAALKATADLTDFIEQRFVRAEAAALDAAVKSSLARQDARTTEAEGIRQFISDQEAAALATARASEDTAKAAQAEYEQFGLLKSQIAEVTLKRLQDGQASLSAGTVAYDSLQRQIDAQKQLIGIFQKGEARDAASAAAKEAATAWRKTADDIERSTTDALLRGFESGKGFAENLRDTLVNMFKTLVLRPVISAVVNPVAGALTGALGLAGTANAASGAGGMFGGSSLVSGISAMAGNFGAGIAEGFATAWGASGSLSGALSMGSGMMSAGSLAGGAGAIVGALGPIALGIGALVAIAESTRGEQRSGGQYGYSFNGATVLNARRGSMQSASGIGATYLEGPSGGDFAAKQVSAAINATVGGINATLKAVGSSATLVGFRAGYETSDRSRGGVFAGGTLSGGRAFGDSGQGDNYAGTLFDASKGFNQSTESALKNLALDLQQATIEALQAAAGVLPVYIKNVVSTTTQEIRSGRESDELVTVVTDTITNTLDAAATAAAEFASDVPKTIRDLVRGVDTKALSAEAAAGLLATIDAVVKGVTDFKAIMLTLPFEQLKNLSFDTAAGLIAASGGLEKLGANLGTYFANFYSEQEQALQARKNIAATLNAAGGSFTADSVAELTRPAFRALVEQTDVSSPLYAALLGVAGAFAAITPQAEAASTAVSEITKRLQADTANLQVELLRAQGNTSGATAAQRVIDTAGFTAAEVAIYDYNASLRAQIAALQDSAAAAQAATAAQAAAAQQQAAIATERAGLDKQLLQLQGNTVALRQLEAAGLDVANRALYFQIVNFQDQQARAAQAAAAASEAAQAFASAQAAAVQQAAAVNNERLGLDKQLLQLQGNTNALRALERAALDATNRALYDQITALQDSAAAASKAAATQAEAAQKLAAIATERAGLDRQLLQLQGDTTSLRALERRALDASNQGLYDQINALQDSQAASAAAAEASQTLYNGLTAQAKAFQDAAAELANFSQSILDFKVSLGLGSLSTLSPQEQYNSATSAFNSTAAAAAKGDKGALASLQSVAQAYLQASQAFNGSTAAYSADFAAVQTLLSSVAATATQLASTATQSAQQSTTAALLAAIAAANDGPGVYIGGKKVRAYAAGGLASGWSMVGEQGPELVNFTNPGRVYNTSQTAMALNSANDANSGETQRHLQAGVRVSQAGFELLAAKLDAVEQRLAGIERTGRKQAAA